MKNSNVNMSISSQKLTELIQSGALCAADFRCLDLESKQTVWQMCLWCCSKRIHCSHDCTKNCPKPCTDSVNLHTTTSIEQADQITSKEMKYIDII
ncbi:hypothetical protein Ssed_2208 [Shewanella sediminis HAW-EB3]|uniref:Uncharacterized protein n=1 Tax=Shewanella sediminis (strain HAW-EB3) TaxID=425104 RepID=A8FVE4_SHESH|nr:hypothetical protein [Shewanella sediminis]ABV36817.1 hypothetical protein Ssed_2208 [Shewanella sediminis HAW-EB3]